MHKLRALSAAMGIGFLACTAAANASVLTGPFLPGSGSYTLVPNGDFESGLSGWSPVGGNGSFTANTLTPIVGSTSAQSSASSAFNGAGFAIYHSVAITPGTYVLSGFINTSATAVGDNSYLDLNDVWFEPSLLTTSGMAQTQFVYDTFTVPSGYASVNVRCVRDNNVPLGVPTLFDDIAITPLASFVAPTAVPEPSIACVIAMAAGLGLLRHRGSDSAERHCSVSAK